MAKPRSGPVSRPTTIREATKILSAAGFREINFQGKRRKGRHCIWEHPETKVRCPLPRGNGGMTISPKVANTVLRLADLR